MNKLLVISQHFPPEIGAASNRMEQLTLRLAQRGWTLYVVTAQPSYPEPALYQDVSDEGERDRLRQMGIHLFRTPSVARLLSGKAARAANQLLFLAFALLISLWICLRHRVGICLTTSPPFPVNLVGWFLATFFRVKWVMEVRDLWPDSLLAVTRIQASHPLFKLLKRLERLFYRTARQVVVVTQAFKEQLVQSGVPEHKLAVITNGIPDWVWPYLREKEGRKEESSPSHLHQDPLDEAEMIRVVYIGNLGLAQGLEQILKVAQFFDRQNVPKERDNGDQQPPGTGSIHFYFVGEGLAKPHLMEQAKKEGLTNVHFIPGQTDKQTLAAWYQKAHVGVVCLKPDPLFNTVIPSKVFEYGAWGLPILFIGSGEGAEVVQKYGLGLRVDYDTIAIIEGLLTLFRQFRERNRSQVEQFRRDFSWDVLIEDYISLLSRQLSAKGIKIRER